MNYADVDKVLDAYVEEYRSVRAVKQNELRQEFLNLKKECRLRDSSVPKSPILHLKFGEHFTLIRTFVYALSCGINNNDITVDQFMAACNRFGVDNPLPIITKRISLYGNQEDVVKEY